MGYSYTPLSKIKTINLTSTDAVASGGGSDTQNLRPAKGFIYKVKNIRYHAPDVGGAVGDHRIEIKSYDGTDTTNFLRIDSTNAADGIAIGHNTGSAMEFTHTGGTEQPGNDREQFLLCYDVLIAGYDNYLQFIYTNNSDTNQTGNRVLIILVEEAPERV